MKEWKCDICDCALTEGRYPYKNCLDFIKTCDNHKEFSRAFQEWVIRKRLGYTYTEPKRECVICSKRLSENEFNAISENDVNITCTAHIPYKHHYNVDYVKAILNINT